ncbi:carboxypeptidase-like regulatory domain-containing protein [Chitinophaga sp.]|uniref:energy transducer TonB family protein n=1 Tax=Chitinophaga sp. TaxID=1869181 RepID=UPI0031DBCC5D
MADNQGHIKPTAELIRQYLEGTLDDKTMHALEKQALDDPFLAEALEGFAIHPADQQPALEDLQSRLEKRVSGEDKKPGGGGVVRRLDYKWLAAAAVLLIIAVGALLIMNRPLQPVNDIAQVTEPRRADSTAAAGATAADTVPAAAEAQKPATAGPETADRANPSSVKQAKEAPAPLTARTRQEQAAKPAPPPAAAPAQETEGTPGQAAFDSRKQFIRGLPKNASKQLVYGKASPEKAALKHPTLAFTEKIDTIRIGKYAADSTTYAMQTAPPSKVEGKITGAPNPYPNYNSQHDERLISGVVVDAETGRRLPGVSVIESGTNRGVVTDTSGTFAMRVSPRNDVKLDFSYVGYEKTNVAVSAGNADKLNVKLPANNQALADVVVVGYGTQKKQDRTGAANIQIRGISSQPSAEKAKAPHPAVSIKIYSDYLESRRKLVIPGLLENKSGQVRLTFTVMPDSTLRHFKVLESMGDVANKAAIRIIKEGPRWAPASNGKRATAEVTVPLLLLKQE